MKQHLVYSLYTWCKRAYIYGGYTGPISKKNKLGNSGLVFGGLKTGVPQPEAEEQFTEQERETKAKSTIPMIAWLNYLLLQRTISGQFHLISLISSIIFVLSFNINLSGQVSIAKLSIAFCPSSVAFSWNSHCVQNGKCMERKGILLAHHRWIPHSKQTAIKLITIIWQQFCGCVWKMFVFPSKAS